MTEQEKNWIKAFVKNNGGNPEDPTEQGTKSLPYTRDLDPYTKTYSDKDWGSTIPRAEMIKRIAKIGGVRETLPLMQQVVKECSWHVSGVAKSIKTGNLEQDAYHVWRWIKENVHYAPDEAGKEQIRTPARIWSERITGVDCDDYAIMAASLLKEMGYEPKFKLNKFLDKRTGLPKKQHGHVYVVVGEYAIDPVMHLFNREPTNRIVSEDLIVGMGGCGCREKNKGTNALSGIERIYDSDLFSLHPVAETNDSFFEKSGRKIGEGFNGFDHRNKTPMIFGLDAIDEPSTATKKLIKKQIVCPKNAKHARKMRYAIMLNGSELQEDFLASIKFIDEITQKGVIIPKKDKTLMDVYCAIKANKIRKGINKIKNLVPVGTQGVDELTNVEKEIKNWINGNDQIDGLGLFKKIGKGLKRAYEKSKKEFSKASKKIQAFAKRQALNVKDFVKNPGKHLKNIQRGLAKVFPATLIGRNAFLGLIKLNFAKMADKLYPLTLSDEQIEKNAKNDQAKRALKDGKNRMAKTWMNLGGDVEKLFSAIKNGAKKKLGEYDDLGGLFSVPSLAMPTYAGNDVYKRKSYIDERNPVVHPKKWSALPIYAGNDAYAYRYAPKKTLGYVNIPIPALNEKEIATIVGMPVLSAAVNQTAPDEIDSFLVHGLAGLAGTGLGEPATSAMLVKAAGVIAAISSAVAPALKTIKKLKEEGVFESAKEIKEVVDENRETTADQDETDREDDREDDVEGLLGKRKRKSERPKSKKKSERPKSKKKSERPKSKKKSENKKHKKEEKIKRNIDIIADKFEDSTGIKIPGRKRKTPSGSEAVLPQEQGYDSAHTRTIMDNTINDKKSYVETIKKYAPLIAVAGIGGYLIYNQSKRNKSKN